MKLSPYAFFLLVAAAPAGSCIAQDLQTIAKQKPLAVSGSLDVRGIFYSASGMPPRREAFTYLLSGSPVFRVYGISIPVSFSISEQQRSFRQPFNQFGLSPTYKWITVHGGYRNVTFSPYTLAGYTMLGAGLELNPGKFRFGVMYGRLNKATEIDSTTGYVQPYSFSRKGFAARLGWGTDERLIEFSLLSAKDDSTSVAKGIPDSLRTVTPAANAVASVRAVYGIGGRFSFEGDAGLSLYTYNSGSRIQSAEFAKIGSLLRDLVPVNASSQLNLAYSAALTYKAPAWSLKVSYRYVDPEFQSMGAYFFNNDFRNITFTPAFSLNGGALRFNGSIGVQQDNLRKQKEQTTSRVIGSANVGWDINDAFGVDANYTNYSTSTAPEVVQVAQKYLLAQTAHNLSVTPRFVRTGVRYTHVLLLSLNYAALVDANPATKDLNGIQTTVAFLNYSLNFNKTGWAAFAGLSRSENSYYGGKALIYGGSFGGSKALLKNRLQLASSNAISVTRQVEHALVINATVTAAYNLNTHHRFTARWMLLNNRPDMPMTASRFTEHTSELAYTWSF